MWQSKTPGHLLPHLLYARDTIANVTDGVNVVSETDDYGTLQGAIKLNGVDNFYHICSMKGDSVADCVNVFHKNDDYDASCGVLPNGFIGFIWVYIKESSFGILYLFIWKIMC